MYTVGVCPLHQSLHWFAVYAYGTDVAAPQAAQDKMYKINYTDCLYSNI